MRVFCACVVLVLCALVGLLHFGAGLRPPTEYKVMRMESFFAGHFSSTNDSHEGFFTRVHWSVYGTEPSMRVNSKGLASTCEQMAPELFLKNNGN